MKCVTCDKEFEAKRADAQFCSSTCRSKKSRATDNLSVALATDKRTATDNSANVATDKYEPTGNPLERRCFNCGLEFNIECDEHVGLVGKLVKRSPSAKYGMQLQKTKARGV